VRKPLHKHEKNPAGLARSRRPLMTRAPRSQGLCFDARVIAESVAGAELKHACGSDLPVREQSCDGLQALISALFIAWMPHGLEAVRVLPRVTG